MRYWYQGLEIVSIRTREGRRENDDIKAAVDMEKSDLISASYIR